jgi:hypothetical protein
VTNRFEDDGGICGETFVEKDFWDIKSIFDG